MIWRGGKPGQLSGLCNSFTEKGRAGLGTKATEQSKEKGMDLEGFTIQKDCVGVQDKTASLTAWPWCLMQRKEQTIVWHELVKRYQKEMS